MHILPHAFSISHPISWGFSDPVLPPVASSPAGLVYSKTSVTPLDSVKIKLDPHASRVTRLRSALLTGARLHCEQRSKWRVAMLTLTYRPDVEWFAFQISDCLRLIRQYLARKGVEFRYIWVQEHTKRGMPHYHVLIWLPLGLSLPKPDKRGWWPHGMTKIEWARNAVGYIAKYASKADSLHPFATGARIYGVGGLTGSALIKWRWWRLPGWLRDIAASTDLFVRHVGGGFVSRVSGEIIFSPFIVFFKNGYLFLLPRSAVTAL